VTRCISDPHNIFLHNEEPANNPDLRNSGQPPFALYPSLMPLRFKRRILGHIAHERYSPQQVERMADELRIEDDDLDAFREALEQLATDGAVLMGAGGEVLLPPPGEEIIGVFRRNPKGFGFLIPRDPKAHGDLFVAPPDTLNALTGDLVRARVVHDKRRGGPDGRSPYTAVIEEVLERARTRFSGELKKVGGRWIVFPDGKALEDPVVVRDAGAKNASEGDKVLIELLRIPVAGSFGEGVITKVLGEAGEPDVETAAVIATYDLHEDFDESCAAEARDASIAFEEAVDRLRSEPFETVFPDREDRRAQFILTIDPPDARDYDDALSIERQGDGWRLGVHIADVSHFVAQGGPLDVEASKRCNSTYLPRRVLPMLPELLSNGVCSLQEGEPRYTKSAYIQYDSHGNATGKGFAACLIKSAKRLTYLEAQALIDGDETEAKKHAKTEPNYTTELREALGQFNALARTIRERRKKQGMIHLDLPEVELLFGDDGRVVDAQPEDDAFTHTLIEMFMVEANEAVARLFEELRVPLIRRAHPEPAPGALEHLAEFIKLLGYRLPKSPDRFDLQALLDTTAKTPSARAVHFSVLRSLNAAEYLPANIGHFALASEAYANFTSPIRRYADLTVHRALTEYLARTDNGKAPPRKPNQKKSLGREMARSDACPPQEALLEVARACTRREENSEAAERELRAFLVLELMEQHVGEMFQGVVTGVAAAGVFIQLEKYLVEGLIRMNDLPQVEPSHSPRWRLEKQKGAIVEQHSGRSFKLGDRVEVVVANVDLARRQMELLIPSDEAAKRVGVGKALKLGGDVGGGLAGAGGAGFGEYRTGGQRRSHKSKRRDKAKKDHRSERKNKGKRT